MLYAKIETESKILIWCNKTGST